MQIYRNKISSYQNTIDSILRKNHAPLTADYVNLIDTWMTFSYINTIFKLPADYLKTNLNITDMRYPNITLGGYIIKNKLDKNIYLESVKKAVSDYFAKK
jgi:hypothetical protein